MAEPRGVFLIMLLGLQVEADGHAVLGIGLKPLVSGIAGSNTAEYTDVCLVSLFCAV
jgi:hypothetical protein